MNRVKKETLFLVAALVIAVLGMVQISHETAYACDRPMCAGFCNEENVGAPCADPPCIYKNCPAQ